MREIRLYLTKKQEIVDITNELAEAVDIFGVEEGILNSLSNIVPKTVLYAHQHGSNHGLRAAHVKSALFGASQASHVNPGKLQLGTWQNILFDESDGHRSCRMVLPQVFRT